MKRTTGLIEKGKDGNFTVFTPDLDHTIFGEGISVSEAKKDFANSLAEMLDSYKSEGKEVPLELQDIEFEFKYDVASIFDYFDFINVTKFARRVGINASLLRQYKLGKQYMSEAQAKKIETALHQTGESLTQITLV